MAGMENSKWHSFSVTYDAESQIRFERLFEEGRLEEARAVLDNLPEAQKDGEGMIHRMMVQNEGYKRILNEYEYLGGPEDIVSTRNRLEDLEGALDDLYLFG